MDLDSSWRDSTSKWVHRWAPTPQAHLLTSPQLLSAPFTISSFSLATLSLAQVFPVLIFQEYYKSAMKYTVRNTLSLKITLWMWLIWYASMWVVWLIKKWGINKGFKRLYLDVMSTHKLYIFEMHTACRVWTYAYCNRNEDIKHIYHNGNFIGKKRKHI